MNNPQQDFSTSNNPRTPNPDERGGGFTTPLSQRGWPRWLVYLGSLVGGIYLLNPTAGLLELLPDNLPIVGNLDEVGAVMLVWYGILEYIRRRRQAP